LRGGHGLLDHPGSSLSFPTKEHARARGATIHHRAHLGAVLRPAPEARRRPPARLPPCPHPRRGGLREAGRGPGVRLRLQEKIAEEGCSATTLRRRRDEWIGAGAVDALREMALEAHDRMIGLKLSDVAVGCWPRGGEKAGRSPVDRGKRGIKRSVAVDAKGIPLTVVPAPANCHGSPLCWAEPSMAFSRLWEDPQRGERPPRPRLRLERHPPALGGSWPARCDLRERQARIARGRLVMGRREDQELS
jgi:hypothetical protein